VHAHVIADGPTIVAVSTSVGRGALAIVRVSGRDVPAIAEALLMPMPSVPRRATRCMVRDAAGSILDDAIATRYVAPHSFTGEDLLEITTHGGVLTPTLVTAAAVAAGARIAEPGEFTRRALLHGKLDLMQAEAIGDLIDSRSLAAHKLAIRQLDGGLSRRVGALRQQLLELEAQLAYDIDFPEEDDGPMPRERIIRTAKEVMGALNDLLATGNQGALVHDGALVVLAGAPNTGKSSLFNALIGEGRAIVTEVPGTTRDAIEAVLDTPRYPLRLVDTAGLREPGDLVERLGIEVSSRYLARADVVLGCIDTSDSRPLVEELSRLTTAPVITVRTKADLLSNSYEHRADVAVSASTGAGLFELLRLIENRLLHHHGIPALDAPVLTRTRHRVAVAEATNELDLFIDAWMVNALPASVAATHIREAGRALGTLIGVVETEEILDVVFRNFCVGK
jgi:tRNA modification GTPase TrmE